MTKPKKSKRRITAQNGFPSFTIEGMNITWPVKGNLNPWEWLKTVKLDASARNV